MISCVVLLLIAWLVDMPLYASVALSAAACVAFMCEWYFVITAVEKRATREYKNDN